MSKYLPAFIALAALLTPVAVFAAPYVPLEPLPFVPTNAGGNLPAVLQGLFQLLVIGGAGIAVLMITIGGVQYMTGDSLHQKSEGRERIQGAVLGLLLLFGIYIILRAINPDLLNFDLRSITKVGGKGAQQAQNLGGSSGSNLGGAATPGPGSGGNGGLTIDITPNPQTPGTKYVVTWYYPDGTTGPRSFTKMEDCQKHIEIMAEEPPDRRPVVVTDCRAVN